MGASARSIVLMVIRQGLVLTLSVTALGLVGAIALTRLIGSLLFATSPTDIVTFGAVSVVFPGVAALACLHSRAQRDGHRSTHRVAARVSQFTPV